MFVLSAVLVTLATAVQGVATWGFFEDLNALVGMDPAQMENLATGPLLATLQSALIGYTISGFVSFLITTILNGLLIHAVSQAVIGRKMSLDRKSTRLNSSHVSSSYAVFCLKKKNSKRQN